MQISGMGVVRVGLGSIVPLFKAKKNFPDQLLMSIQSLCYMLCQDLKTDLFSL